MRRRRFPSASAARRLFGDLALLPRLWTAGRRPLPDFLVIGAQRAGTTSLFRCLGRHPDIRGAPIKEVHYFDAHEDYGEDWYRAHFPTRRDGGVSGEATPYYLFHPRCPDAVRELLPNARLIAVLRDPVERAISHFRHEVRWGFEDAADLGVAIAREPSRLAGEEQRLLDDSRYFSVAHNHASYLARGEYARQLRAWYERFPREQLLVLTSERLFADPSGELARVQEHLGVPMRELGTLPHFNRTTQANVDADLRTRLVEHFRPHNRELYELLGDDLGWEA